MVLLVGERGGSPLAAQLMVLLHVNGYLLSEPREMKTTTVLEGILRVR